MLRHRKIFPIVLILTLLVLTIRCGSTGGGCSSGETGTINLAWDPNTESAVAGYKVYYGTSPRTYGPGSDVGNVKTFALTGLIKGRRYFISVKAYNTSRHESDFSNEVSGIAK
jgi:hypothetical protein